MLRSQLRVKRPLVVYNCPERWLVPDPRPDLIRERLGLPPTTRIALYHGGLMSDRGIRESMEAVLSVPDTALVLLGYGPWRDRLAGEVEEPPYQGRVFLIDAVPSSELLEWVASADVAVIPIQDTSPNHRYGTANKLWEAIAAGVPVVASDLPGMRDIVRETGCGVLVDGSSPASIAEGMRSILLAPAEERAAMVGRCLRAHRETYNWESQEDRLLVLYRRLLEVGRRRKG
jgi:glycosyltransferase involved in cell wall biosynthesis